MIALLLWARIIVIERPARLGICILFILLLQGCGMFGGKSSSDEITTVNKEAINTTKEANATIDNLDDTNILSDSSEVRFDAIDQMAASSEQRFDDVGDVDGVQEQVQIQVQAQAGMEEQQFIQLVTADGIEHQLAIAQSAEKILLTTPNIIKPKSVWDQIVDIWNQFFWIIVIVGGFLILKQSGAFKVMRGFANLFGLLVPTKLYDEAKLDQKILDPNDPTTIRESIAIKRQSTAYKAAYKKVERDSV